MQPPSNESKHANRVAYITGGCIIAFMIFIIFSKYIFFFSFYNK